MTYQFGQGSYSLASVLVVSRALLTRFPIAIGQCLQKRSIVIRQEAWKTFIRGFDSRHGQPKGACSGGQPAEREICAMERPSRDGGAEMNAHRTKHRCC
ncbi:MAG: hypothetical protein F4Y47_17840 [Acidobacteriia bacterium]|nr:hypothetical protein [Terriglobia bacterium]